MSSPGGVSVELGLQPSLPVFLLWRRSRWAWGEGRPWGSGRARMILVMILVVVVVAAYIVAAVADPLVV